MHDFVANLPQTLDQVIQSVPLFKPELALIGAFLAIVCATLFIDQRRKPFSFFIYIGGLLLSFPFLYQQLDRPAKGFFDMLIIDSFSIYARMLILFALLVTGILVRQHFKAKPIRRPLGEVYSMLMAAGLGLYLLAGTSNWLIAFIAIETVSISSYVLVGYFSEHKRQSEAAMKYVLFGSVSAATMLYGLSLIY